MEQLVERAVPDLHVQGARRRCEDRAVHCTTVRPARRALFYNFDTNEVGSPVGTDGLRTFWGGTLTGDDYWLSLPAAAKGQAVPAPEKTLPFTQKASVITGTANSVTEDQHSFLRAKATKRGTTLAVRTMQYGPRDSYSPVAIRVRTTAPATLLVRSTANGTPYQRVNVPNTNGEWRYVTYDMATRVVPVSAMGDNNIAFYTFSGKAATIDLESVTPQAGTQLAKLAYTMPSVTAIGVQDVPLQVDLAADHSDKPVTYSAAILPRGSSINPSTGLLTWTPGRRQVGDFTFRVQAEDGTTSAATNVTIRVAANRNDALTLALSKRHPSETYTTASTAPVDAAAKDAKALLTSASDSDFASALQKVQLAVSKLQLLNPTLPGRFSRLVGPRHLPDTR